MTQPSGPNTPDRCPTKGKRSLRCPGPQLRMAWPALSTRNRLLSPFFTPRRPLPISMAMLVGAVAWLPLGIGCQRYPELFTAWRPVFRTILDCAFNAGSQCPEPPRRIAEVFRRSASTAEQDTRVPNAVPSRQQTETRVRMRVGLERQVPGQPFSPLRETP